MQARRWRVVTFVPCLLIMLLLLNTSSFVLTQTFILKSLFPFVHVLEEILVLKMRTLLHVGGQGYWPATCCIDVCECCFAS